MIGKMKSIRICRIFPKPMYVNIHCHYRCRTKTFGIMNFTRKKPVSDHDRRYIRGQAYVTCGPRWGLGLDGGKCYCFFSGTTT